MTQHTAFPEGFEASFHDFVGLCQEVQQQSATDLYSLEAHLCRRGQALLRQIAQDWLNQRSRAACEHTEDPYRLQQRQIEGTFGTLAYERPAQLRPGQESLRPLDAELNVPVMRYSHFFQRLVCQEVACRSYDEVLASFTGLYAGHLPKRQMEAIVNHCAQDFEAFYALSSAEKQASGPFLVGSMDRAGVVMRPEGLREPTRKKALAGGTNRQGKRSHKRAATVAAVYATEAFERTAQDIVERKAKPGPRPRHKRVWASLARELKTVVKELFAEMRERDPTQVYRWLILVDGDASQLQAIQREARRQNVQVTIILDLIHVVSYLWKAAACFYDASNTTAAGWVEKQLLQVLQGKAGRVAGQIKRKATRLKLTERKGVDECAGYLLKYKAYLRYDHYLAQGYPIATGVIEGACRYMVKDRMDLTGSRWGLAGGEAVLKLRSILKAGDFDAYWDFHLEQERRRNHAANLPETPFHSDLEAA